MLHTAAGLSEFRFKPSKSAEIRCCAWCLFSVAPQTQKRVIETRKTIQRSMLQIDVRKCQYSQFESWLCVSYDRRSRETKVDWKIVDWVSFDSIIRFEFECSFGISWFHLPIATRYNCTPLHWTDLYSGTGLFHDNHWEATVRQAKRRARKTVFQRGGR